MTDRTKKYTNKPTILKKFFVSFKYWGVPKTIRYTLMKLFLPIFVYHKKKNKFNFEGCEFSYFYHTYNNTWDNERCVEAPIFKRYLNEALLNNWRVLEIGNVLSHYHKRDRSWDILDKFEKALDVINEDIIKYKPRHKYDLIISISTIEHVGFDDAVEDPTKIIEAIKHIKSLLKKGGKFIFSFPVGYNKTFDNDIFSDIYGLSKVVYLKRIGYWTWNEAKISDAKTAVYGAPFYAGNVVAICYL